MARNTFTAEEVMAFMDSDKEWSEFEEKKSVDGNREVPEYINSLGEAEVVSHSALDSSFVQEDAEPATQYSMLYRCYGNYNVRNVKFSSKCGQSYAISIVAMVTNVRNVKFSSCSII